MAKAIETYQAPNCEFLVQDAVISQAHTAPGNDRQAHPVHPPPPGFFLLFHAFHTLIFIGMFVKSLCFPGIEFCFPIALIHLCLRQ